MAFPGCFSPERLTPEEQASVFGLRVVDTLSAKRNIFAPERSCEACQTIFLFYPSAESGRILTGRSVWNRIKQSAPKKRKAWRGGA